jgi:ABC transport system ATP-binding/permease protein
MGATGQSRHSQGTLGKTVSIGSDPTADFQLEGIFPLHARITCRPDDCLIEDLTRADAGASQTWFAPFADPGDRTQIVHPKVATYDDFLYLGLLEFPLSRLRPPSPGARFERSASPQAEADAIMVGGSPSDRISIDGPSVSPHHASFRRAKSDCWVRDNRSANGTFWVDPDNPTHYERIGSQDWTRLSYSDVVTLGSSPFHLSRLLEIKDISLSGYPVAYIGRSPENDCVLDHVSVSRFHARLSLQGGRILAEDLGSISGTFLNSKRLAAYAPQALGAGDSLSVGPYRLSQEPGSTRRVRVDSAGDVKLDVHDLRCDIGAKNVLQDISFSVLPGEFLGILGPSGHGKSVLLECLLQKRPLRVRGEIRINGRRLDSHSGSFRELTGYVPQGEVLPTLLTVEQVLSYAARLWIRSDLTSPEIDRQIDSVLGQLGIGATRRQPLRVLSGGELRRVSIAYELIRSPHLLLLDEPTTGLSSKDAWIVMATLRKLAESRHTLISVIHQPSANMYASFHLVVILFAGRILYCGPPQFSYRYFECGAHPEHVFRALENYEAIIERHPEQREQLLDEWTEKYKNSEDYRDYVAARLSNSAQRSSP